MQVITLTIGPVGGEAQRRADQITDEQPIVLSDRFQDRANRLWTT